MGRAAQAQAVPKPKIISTEMITIGIDSREQNSYAPELEKVGFKTEIVTLDTADYTLIFPDLSSVLAIERKSLEDFIKSSIQDRERFTRELRRMKAYRYPYLIVEASATEIAHHEYRSKAHENSILGSIARYTMMGISVLLADNRKAAAYITGRLCLFVAQEICSYACLLCNRGCQQRFPEPIGEPAPVIIGED